MTEIRDQYWIRPTDLASDWVRLGEDVAGCINGRSHCQVQLGVIVNGGAVSDMVEPVRMSYTLLLPSKKNLVSITLAKV